MRIDSSGNVGIGTPSPTAKLSVDQPSTTAISTTGGAAAGQIFTNEDFEFAFGLGNASPYPLYIQGRTSNPAVSAARNLALQPIGGNVSIGTQSALDRLHVETASTQAHSTTLTKGTNTPGVWITNSNNDNNMSGLHLATSSGTHFSSIIGARTNNAAHWGTHLSFYTHNDNTSGINTATEKMRISGNGLVTTPMQPAFRAGYTSGSTITNNVNNKHPFTSVAINRGNNYSGPNARFTAPVAGIYRFNACFWVNANNNCDFAPRLNGSSWVPSAPNSDSIVFVQKADSYIQNLSGTFMLELQANDYVELQSRNYTSNYYAGHSWWEGHLIG